MVTNSAASGRLQGWIDKALVDSGSSKLDEIVRSARLADASWQSIRDEIRDRAGESVSVQTLITWFPQYNKPADELAAALADELTPAEQ